MITHVKLLFDENIGRPMLDAMKPLLSKENPPPILAHLLDFFDQGMSDSEWIPKIAQEDWIVLTGDRARRSGGPKLPSICAAHCVTHVLVSGKLQQQKQFEKVRAIIAVWPDIKKLVNEPRGSRYSLRYSHSMKPVLVKAS